MSSDVRNQLREQIFSGKKFNSKEIEFFGAKIELRQPSLQDILKAKEENNRQSAVVSMLIDYAFIPKTDEKVFEEADAEMLLSMPFGKNFTELNNALEELTEVNFRTPEKASDETLSDD